MKLDRYQMFEIFNTEKVADDNTGVYDIHFDILLGKLSISNEDKFLIKKLYQNNQPNTEKEHLKKISELLDSKIDMFSNDFWEIFFFRKHNYHSQYSQKNWNQFNETYESVKDVKKKIKVLKSFNISINEFENFITQLSYVQDSYVDFWFNLKKKNKDTILNEKMKENILKYGSIDFNEVQKANFLSYFKEVEELENLYNKSHNTAYQREIENELLKFKAIESNKKNLFEEMQYHSIVYRKNISINENSLIYDLHKDKKTIEKIVKVIEQFLTREVYSIISNYNEALAQYIYTIEGYSEENLNEKNELVKKAFTHLPELLLKKEYVELFKDNIYVNEEMNQFFRQYIKSSELYKNLDNKFPEKNIKNKKNKI